METAKARRFSQRRKFEKRSRDEDPSASTQRVLHDEYLRAMYTRVATRLVALTGLDPENLDGANVAELGSAGGITKEVFPKVITSDVRAGIGIDRIIDGASLPFEDGSMDALIAKDVLHHIPDPRGHFSEVTRVLRPGGKIAYLEPNWNGFSRLIFSTLHPEPFLPNSTTWDIDPLEPMYSNQALAEIIFVRDRTKFDRQFPALKATVMETTNGLSFLASGGVYNRTPLSAKFLGAIGAREARSRFLQRAFGLNRYIVIERLEYDA